MLKFLNLQVVGANVKLRTQRSNAQSITSTKNSVKIHRIPKKKISSSWNPPQISANVCDEPLSKILGALFDDKTKYGKCSSKYCTNFVAEEFRPKLRPSRTPLEIYRITYVRSLTTLIRQRREIWEKRHNRSIESPSRSNTSINRSDRVT